MGPGPGTVFWESLKQGMVVWPYEMSPGTYFGLPIYLVLPALMILGVAVGFIVHFMSKPREENSG